MPLKIGRTGESEIKRKMYLGREREKRNKRGEGGKVKQQNRKRGKKRKK